MKTQQQLNKIKYLDIGKDKRIGHSKGDTHLALGNRDPALACDCPGLSGLHHTDAVDLAARLWLTKQLE
jgi:hypothetical protein